jgi:hypothetical protein
MIDNEENNKKLNVGEVYSSRDKYFIVGNHVVIDNERFHQTGAIFKNKLAFYAIGMDSGSTAITLGYNHPEDLPGPGVRKATREEVELLRRCLIEGRTNGLAGRINHLEEIGINIENIF